MAPENMQRKEDAVSRVKFPLFILFAFFIIPLSYCTMAIDPALSLRFLLLGLLVLLLGIFSFMETFSKPGSKRNPVSKTFALLLAGFFLINLFSLVPAVNKSEGIFQCAKMFLFCSFIWFSSSLSIGSPARIQSIAKAIAVCALVVSAFGILECWGILRLIDAEGVGPGATMVNRNLLSSYLFLCLGFVLFLCIDQKGIWRYVGLISYAMLFYCIVATKTRAVWLATAVALAAVIILMMAAGLRSAVIQNMRKNKILWAALVLIPFLCGVLITAGGPPVAPDQSLIKRILSMTDTGLDSNRERIRLWSKTVKMIRGHAITGVGAGNWKIALPVYGTGDLVSPDMKIIETRPYNDFLQVGSETGVAGLVLYLGFFLLCLTYAIRGALRSRDRSQCIFSAAMFMTISGYAVISFFDFPMERIEHLVLIGTVFASCIGVSRGPAEPRWLPVQPERAILVMIMILSGLCIGIGMLRFKGDFHSARMLQAFTSHDFNTVITESDRAFSLVYTMEPSSSPLHWYRGVAEFKLGNRDQALNDYLLAKRCNPNHIRVLNDLGACWSLKGEQGPAENCFRTALKISPCFEPALINLSAECYNNGRYQEALIILSKCKSPHTDPRYDYFLKTITEKTNKGEVQ